MLYRSQNNEQIPLNIVGGSSFGRYPDISVEKTYNMFISDEWLVDYAGYQLAIPYSSFDNGTNGRAIHSSTKLNKLIVVIDANVYLVDIDYSQTLQKVTASDVTKIGVLNTHQGIVYITENNTPQILISDQTSLYIYDANFPLTIPAGESFQELTLQFIPGYIDFHDTYFLVAASQDSVYSPPVNNTWRIQPPVQLSNGIAVWDNTSATVGLLQTKPDNTQAVVRFPSMGNMIFVFGRTVTEPWYDVGAQIFPYQRNSSSTIDYGCLSPATIGTNDSLIVWLGINERSGPVIMYSSGGMAEKISTDGIDFFLSSLRAPEDSQGFLFRQDGHILYHLNFYTDNVSLFYDFNTKKFFFASDENLNYFIASNLAFFNNQYYFTSRNNGNLYTFDTAFTTYDGEIIPRIRVCKNIRFPEQDYFVTTDLGFTIESGSTNYIQQNRGPIYFITQESNNLVTNGGPLYFITQDGNYLTTQDVNNIVSQQSNDNSSDYLISEQDDIVNVTPRIDLSVSTDGGEHFSSYVSYEMPPIGRRKNKLMWWQIGTCNNLVCQFRFYGIGRFVATDGIANIRK